jgi:hypothetical protein
MAGFLFTLERADGTPAERSSLSSAAPNWSPVTRSTLATRRSAWLPCETMTPTRLRCWSVRTWPNDQLRVLI